MTFLNTRLALTSLGMVLSFIGFAGCNPAEQQTGDAPGQENHAADDHAGHDHGSEAHSEEVEEALAALSPADRAAAEKQRICPVTEELLGSMGTPLKITVDGKDVFICCQGCEDALRGNPEEYLSKIDQ